MFKANQKELSVPLQRDLNDVLLYASEPSAVAVDKDAARRSELLRVYDRIPHLFNIDIDDINALPDDQRMQVTDALLQYFRAQKELAANQQSGSASEGLAKSTDVMTKLVRNFRAKISASFKSPALKETMQNKYLHPRSLEFTGQRFANAYAMNLADIDGVVERQPALVQAFSETMFGHLSQTSSGNVKIANGHIEYSRLYAIEMRQPLRDLERQLIAAGLLPKPMLELMRKAGHDRVHDLVFHERNIRAPQLVKGLQDKTPDDSAGLFATMEEYVLAGRISGEHAKKFDECLFQLGVTA